MNNLEKGKVNNLQGLRFVAFLLIFLNHSYWHLGINKVFDFGARGVEIFFVLSGFLVAYNYQDKNIDCSLKGSIDYLGKKIKKFYILHIVTFLFYFFTPCKKYLLGKLSDTEVNKFIVDTVLNITLLKSWYFPSAFSFNGVTWFLSTILFAYFFVPKLVMFFKKRNMQFCMMGFFLVLILKIMLDTYGYKIPHSFHAFSLYTNPAYRFMDFLLGYLFYMVIKSCEGEFNHTWQSVLQVVVSVAYVVSCFVFDKLWTPSAYILLTLVLLYVITFKNGIFNSLLGNPLLVKLGGWSFELFILHCLVIKLCGKLNRVLFAGEVNGKLFWFGALLISIVVSAIVSKKPWLKYTSKVRI